MVGTFHPAYQGSCPMITNLTEIRKKVWDWVEVEVYEQQESSQYFIGIVVSVNPFLVDSSVKVVEIKRWDSTKHLIDKLEIGDIIHLTNYKLSMFRLNLNSTSVVSILYRVLSPSIKPQIDYIKCEQFSKTVNELIRYGVKLPGI